MEIDGVRDALGEDLLGDPGVVRLPLGEVDHRLLGAPQVEGRSPVLHRLADRGHVGIYVRVQKLEKHCEVLRVAFMRRCRQHQHVVGAVAEQLAQGVASGLARRRRP
jgi:hypothetical protein